MAIKLCRDCTSWVPVGSWQGRCRRKKWKGLRWSQSAEPPHGETCYRDKLAVKRSPLRVRPACAICGYPIHNRGRYNPYRKQYAHRGCVMDKYGTLVEWEPIKKRR